MLLDFRVKNYKSFVDDADFSMLAAPKQKGLDYSLMSGGTGKKSFKCLSNSVIYGPNAAGKTNIIGAMEVLRSVVLRGNIRNQDSRFSPDYAVSSLELIPNSRETEPKPVRFFIDFYETAGDTDKFRIQYTLNLDLGMFLDAEYPRKILNEELVVNGKTVFQRTDNKVTIVNLEVIGNYFQGVNKQQKETMEDVANNGLVNDELFLTNGFKLIFSPLFAKIILNWFEKKFTVVYRADALHTIRKPTSNNPVYIEGYVDKAAKIFGINSNALGYMTNEDQTDSKLCSLIKDNQNQKIAAISADAFESYGTIRFINIFPLIVQTMKNGGTLVVDEFDASIHPMALMSIINVFHNDEVNINHAQLIFNTHNPIFLNANLYRRDEIKFVERDEVSHRSELYSLSDFGTAGNSGVRKNEDYMNKYFINRYGAIKDIDFTPLFKEVLGVK